MKKPMNSIFCGIALMFLLFIYSISACKKETELQLNFPQFDSIVDIDNNSYKIVKIGNQWWMAENLRVKKYNDGSPIINAASDDLWKAPNGAYCLYKNDEKAPGLLYNWYAVKDIRGLAPKGWHIATDADWQVLEKYLGVSDNSLSSIGWRGSNVANKLKMYGRTNWLADEDYWPTNESGFTAKAGSCRRHSGVWGEPGLSQTGFWWTASEKDSNKAYYRYLDYRNNMVFRHYDLFNCGMSVRCVKDN